MNYDDAQINYKFPQTSYALWVCTGWGVNCCSELESSTLFQTFVFGGSEALWI